MTHIAQQHGDTLPARRLLQTNLHNDGQRHREQHSDGAFVEEAAVQCGFCTPGIIMSAVEIVGSGKQYTREELRKLISGHLCRCTGYQNILNAVERAVDEAHRFVGKGE